MGFARVRPTKFVENLAWVRGYADRRKPSHIALYDLGSKTCEQEIELEAHGIDVVFSLLPVPAGAVTTEELALKEPGELQGLEFRQRDGFDVQTFHRIFLMYHKVGGQLPRYPSHRDWHHDHS